MNSLLRERLSGLSAQGAGQVKVHAASTHGRNLKARKPLPVSAAAQKFSSSEGPDRRHRALRNSSAGTSVDADDQIVSSGSGLSPDVELDPTKPPQFTDEELAVALELLQRGMVEPEEDIQPASKPVAAAPSVPKPPSAAAPAVPITKATTPAAPTPAPKPATAPAARASAPATPTTTPSNPASASPKPATPTPAAKTTPAATPKPTAAPTQPIPWSPAAAAAQKLAAARAQSQAALASTTPKSAAPKPAAAATPAPPPAAPRTPAPQPTAARTSTPTSAPAPKPAAAAKPAPPAAPQPPAVRPEDDPKYLALRKKAREEVATHSPAAVATDRHHWLVFTIPEQPVAGEEVVVYFNRGASETLRHRPRIVCQLAFNTWELDAEDSRLDLMPTSIPRDFGSDFWSGRFKVPENAFEINFVVTDLEGAFDNNNGQDYTFAVKGPMTWERWLDTAAQRAMQMEMERVAAEQARQEEMERQRQLALADGDRQRATDRVNELRNNYEGLRNGAVTLLKKNERVNFVVLPAEPRAGTTVKVLYNAKATNLGFLSPIPADGKLVLKYGFNSWKQPGDLQLKKAVVATLPSTCEASSDDDWWEGEITIPKDAVVLNFVTNFHEHWDNNSSQDYKVPVGLPREYEDMEAFLAAMQVELHKQETAQRLKAEEEERQKQIAREEKRRKAQELVQAVQRKQLRHVLYTEPENIRAGTEVTLFYNPNSTCLAGRDRIFVHCGWNRWTHRMPVVVEMAAPATAFDTHFSAKIKVPLDAYKMDFVFADVEGGDGTYDNRLGLDYHLPVKGSPFKGNPLHVVHIAVEMAPVAKVGGLGDVVTALGRAVKDQGHMVEVILPWYEFFNHSALLKNMQFEKEYQWGGTSLVVTTTEVEGLRVFFIDPRNGFFKTQSVYGRYDDEVRFDFFCKAALEFMLQTQRQPDILHCHDWSTANVAQSYWESYHPYGLWKPKVVFTIHNLEYGQKKIGEAAYFSQKFTTVSPTYAAEITEHPTISMNGHKFMGIRNGIDPELWDPETCMWLPVPYTADNHEEGKAAAREKLRQRLNLTTWQDKFIVAVVSRLTPQKGMHLIKHAAWRALDRGGQFVLLGSAPDPKVQEDFNEFAQQYGCADAAFQFKYDEPLSHLIYAAADIVLVPSMFEPCGLTQMIAMRYGAVPVVRHTGGLKDTVFDVDFDKGRAAWEMLGSTDWMKDGDATNGFAFEGTDNDALDYALNRAIDAWYNDKAWFRGLQKRVMEQDWSWNRPAIDYVELYYAAIKA